MKMIKPSTTSYATEFAVKEFDRVSKDNESSDRNLTIVLGGERISSERLYITNDQAEQIRDILKQETKQ